jgi:protein phosphatase slingshot
VARSRNFFFNSGSHGWAEHYANPAVWSDRSCVNEWNAMDDLESRRPPSPDSLLRHRPDLALRQETELVIKAKLKEIMTSVDLDEVTSKSIRMRLEKEMDIDLADYKSFIDQEMLIILGQMDEATEVFPHLYLGSEWNASNRPELLKNGCAFQSSTAFFLNKINQFNSLPIISRYFKNS